MKVKMAKKAEILNIFVGPQIVTRSRTRLFKAKKIKHCYVGISRSLPLITLAWLKENAAPVPPSSISSNGAANVPGPSGVNITIIQQPMQPAQRSCRLASVAGGNLFSVGGSVAETGFDHLMTARQAMDMNVPDVQSMMPNNGVQIQPRQYFVPFNPFMRFRNPPFALAGRRRSADCFQRMPTVFEAEAENQPENEAENEMVMELGTPNNSTESSTTLMSMSIDSSPNNSALSGTIAMASPVGVTDGDSTAMDVSGSPISTNLNI